MTWVRMFKIMLVSNFGPHTDLTINQCGDFLFIHEKYDKMDYIRINMLEVEINARDKNTRTVCSFTCAY